MSIDVTKPAQAIRRLNRLGCVVGIEGGAVPLTHGSIVTGPIFLLERGLIGFTDRG